MNRAEELVLKQADAGLDSAEEAELELLLRDPATAARCFELIEIEAALRAGRNDAALPAAVLAAVIHDRDSRTETAVLERLRGLSPKWRPPRWKRALVILSLAAGALLAVLLAVVRGEAPIGVVLQSSASDPALLKRAGTETPLSDGSALRAGDGLRSGPKAVEIDITGIARLRLEPFTELILTGPLRFELREGELEADVRPQAPGRPLVISAPDARAVVLGTRLKLSAAADGTRLEVRTGSVRLVRETDGAELVVGECEYSVAAAEAAFEISRVEADAAAPPEVTRFSLITHDSPREPIPGFEDLKDGAVIDLARLPTRRINLRVDTRPAKVGSVRFSAEGRAKFNTEMVRPYTLVPHNGRKGTVWTPRPGTQTVSVTPFSGSYGNGVRGRTVSLTFTVVDSE